MRRENPRIANDDARDRAPGHHGTSAISAKTYLLIVTNGTAEPGTIGYEVLTSLGGRYNRTYKGGPAES